MMPVEVIKYSILADSDELLYFVQELNEDIGEE